MDRVLIEMISRYECKTTEEYQNALKEIIQDIALLGLWRAKFFEHAAFYGGTALRILHGLDRFSEDLDFMLLATNPELSFGRYQSALENELASFGLTVAMTEKKKSGKANTKEHILRVGAPAKVVESFQHGELVKIKLEVDVEPCEGFVVESRDLLYPVPFSIRTLSLPSLFAGKIHAALCRGWGKRVKGRDWFDMLWFVQRRVPINLVFLEQKVRQTGHYTNEEPLTGEHLRLLLHRRVDELDIDRARDDVVRFLRQPTALEGWSPSIFHTAVDQIAWKE